MSKRVAREMPAIFHAGKDMIREVLHFPHSAYGRDESRALRSAKLPPDSSDAATGHQSKSDEIIATVLFFRHGGLVSLAFNPCYDRATVQECCPRMDSCFLFAGLGLALRAMLLVFFGFLAEVKFLAAKTALELFPPFFHCRPPYLI
jgi:hypothetical protein